MNTTVVACCQLTPVLGDPAANRELTADAITYAAAGRGAGVVVLPELERGVDWVAGRSSSTPTDGRWPRRP